MKSLAQETGARAYFPSDVLELAGIYSSIADELASQYALGYTAKNPRLDGSYRRVIVRVAEKPGVRTRTRNGYFSARSQERVGLSSRRDRLAGGGARHSLDSPPCLSTPVARWGGRDSLRPRLAHLPSDTGAFVLPRWFSVASVCQMPGHLRRCGVRCGPCVDAIGGPGKSIARHVGEMAMACRRGGRSDVGDRDARGSRSVVSLECHARSCRLSARRHRRVRGRERAGYATLR